MKSAWPISIAVFPIAIAAGPVAAFADPGQFSLARLSADSDARVSRRSSEFELGRGTGTTSLVKTKSARQIPMGFAERPRFSSWDARLGFEQDVGAADTLGISVEGLMDRRRRIALPFPADTRSSAALSSRLVWTHQETLRLSAGYAVSRPLRGRGSIERMLERAGGAMPDAEGPVISAELAGNSFAREIGIDAGFQRIGAADLGAPVARSEVRIALRVDAAF